MTNLEKMNETLRAKELRLGRWTLYAITIAVTILTYSNLLLHEPWPVSTAAAATAAVEILTWALLAVTAIVALLATTDHGRERADWTLTADHVLAPIVLVLLLTHDQNATAHTATEATLTATLLLTLTQLARRITKNRGR